MQRIFLRNRSFRRHDRRLSSSRRYGLKIVSFSLFCAVVFFYHNSTRPGTKKYGTSRFKNSLSTEPQYSSTFLPGFLQHFLTLPQWLLPAAGGPNSDDPTPEPSAPRRHNSSVPENYPTLEELEFEFADLVRKFPDLTLIRQIGVSTAGQQPIWAIRVSDRPREDQNEPAVLFTALHHAREPAGVFICQAIMKELLENYGRKPRHTRLVDSLEIWFVPIINPDGYQYIMENQRVFPWWRKNLRDNNHDGRFDPLVDGVDLNRNYGYNWGDGSDGNFSSWFYRGEYAFSENEIQAVRSLARRENFVIGVSFHSYGEAVLYPWANFHRPPDQELILDIAQNYSAQIRRLSGSGTYGILPLNARVGQSSIWMYGELGVIDFICETGEEYFPAFEELSQISAQNVNGALFLLERALRSAISGRIVDDETGRPLVAEVYVAGFERTYVKPRRSDGLYGRFDRLLLPGKYVVEIRKKGYEPVRFNQVTVFEDHVTSLRVRLHKRKSGPSILSY